MRILGIVVIIIGVGLLVGNITRTFYTFPFAGAITIAVGSVMMRAGRG